MRDILMIVHTMGTLDPKDNDRYTYIAKRIIAEYSNCHIEIVTSDFEHHKKKYRDPQIQNYHPFQITFLHENKYKKNISIRRIMSHYSFALRLKKYLQNRKKPDVIYCAVPPITSANVAASYAKKNNIKFIIDVQDLWPESFTIALGDNCFSRAVLSPLMKRVNRVYAAADIAFSVSQTYADRIRKANSIAKIQSVYLGTDLSEYDIDLKESENVKPKEEFWIAYVGNLGNSYDFDVLFRALEQASKSVDGRIVMHILGDGNNRNIVEGLAKQHHPDTIFYGYLPYDKMFNILKQCDVAVNPIKPGTSSSVVNKVGDYAAAGIAVVNTQDNEEYRKLVDENYLGINAIPGDSDSLSRAIIFLYNNENARRNMGNNNRFLYESSFDRKHTYTPIIEALSEESFK